MNDTKIKAEIQKAIDCFEAGNLLEAESIYRSILAVAPAATRFVDLGVILEKLSRFDEAKDAYQSASAADPQDARPPFYLGNLHTSLGEFDAAVSTYSLALKLEPTLAAAHDNLGAVYSKLGRVEEAIRHHQLASELSPALISAHFNCGTGYLRTSQYDKAIAAFHRVLELEPDRSEAFIGLGGVQLNLGHYGEAIALFERAIELDPSLPDAYFNLAKAYCEVSRLNDAQKCYAQAIKLLPDYPPYHGDYSLALLLSGDYAEGWEEYKWRWQQKGAEPKRHSFSRWKGERRQGGRLLLWSEQGIGDQVLHASMVSSLLECGLKITLETDVRLAALMQRSLPEVHVIPATKPAGIDISQFDWQCPLGDLGEWLRPTLDSFSHHKAFLRADPARVREFSQRLRVKEAIRIVGISWASKNSTNGQRKSIPLNEWASVLRAPGVRFVNLQYGDVRAELREIESLGLSIETLKDVDLFQDLDGLTALCAACDLVVTASNVTAHVAGAMGKEVWLLAPAGTSRNWYWPAGSSTTPWYSSMRIYNQDPDRSWKSAMDTVARDLKAALPAS